MSNVFIGKKVQTVDVAPQFDSYSRVTIQVSDDIEYTAGTDTGRAMTLVCPWGTQEMAENILASLKNFRYQPYTASGALADPAAELGDGITVNNVFSGIYRQKTRFGRMFSSDISAPSDEEIDHEYPYVPHQERKITRQLYSMAAELKVQAGLISAEVEQRESETAWVKATMGIQSSQISAKVSKSGGDSASFGWVLDDSSWTISANGSDVLKATKSGLEVYGRITATGGRIGGFDITSDSLSYNSMTWGGTNTSGIYIGPRGIQLGKNFSVDSSGNLVAASGTFSGFVKAGNIQYGGSSGTLPGAALTSGSVFGGGGGAIAGGSITTFNTTGGINTSLGYADFANGVFNEWNTAPVVRCDSIRIGNDYFKPVTIYYANASGGTSYVTVLGFR